MLPGICREVKDDDPLDLLLALFFDDDDDDDDDDLIVLLPPVVVLTLLLLLFLLVKVDDGTGGTVGFDSFGTPPVLLVEYIFPSFK